MAVSELAKSIVTKFLFGQDEVPSPTELASERWIRPNPLPTRLVQEIDQAWVMSDTGPGRFATGQHFDYVRDFFFPTLTGNQASANLQPGTYNKIDLIERLGYGTIENPAFARIFQWQYDDGQSDWAERTYIFNSMLFKLVDDAEFVVASNGSRYINNFAIVATQITNPDNFDFESGDDLAQYFNPLLEERTDPSHIGRTVDFRYINDAGVPRVDGYDAGDFALDLPSIPIYLTPPAAIANFTEMTLYLDDLFDAGITDFRDEQGRPIFYGTEAGDTLSADDLPDAPYLEPYLDNGVVLITGKGDDILKGGGEESRLFGGEGKDIFSLSNMSFIMDGETSDRSFWGGYLISGGVQQWWQEGGYAYTSPIAPLVSFGIGSQILLGALTLFDAPFMTPTRFAMTNAGQLLIQKGRHHTAFVQEYDYEDATAGITIANDNGFIMLLQKIA
jgi:hypothetical protein